MTVTLPLFQLPPRQVYFPGSIIDVQCTKLQAFSLLSRFRLVSKDESILQFLDETEQEDELQQDEYISNSAILGIAKCKDLFDPKDKTKQSWLVIACLPGFNYASKVQVATICRILSLKDNGSSVQISCHAFTRGLVVKRHFNELQVQLQTKESSYHHASNLDRESAIKLIDKIKKFVESYTIAMFANKNVVSRKEHLKRTFLLLSPLANVLYSQLTRDKNTLKLMTNTIAKNLESSSSNLESDLNAIDGFVAIFPFTLQQKCQILFEMDKKARIVKFNEIVKFGIAVFNELESLDLVLDNWNGLESHVLKSKIITTHLKSLKLLVDDFNNAGQKQLTKPAAMGPSSNNNEDEDLDKLDKFIKDMANLSIPPEGKKLILKDYKRIQKMSPNNSEYHTLLSYLEVIQDIPWSGKDHKSQATQIDLDKAKIQLDKDHYGLDNVKDRILEYLAILNLHNKLNIKETSKAPILLLTGPPGVGKTSLLKSVATTLGRNFQRISLGGLKDESEIKGHRRTYVGALPGLIIQLLRKAQSNNPVILLDEIDKVVGGNSSGNKVNGDPAAALLEVLDPEQNINFTDHYIGFPVDLSNVLFLCTSNDHYQLSAPLLDRMELLEINGYNYLEKVQIVKNFILPRQILRSGLPLDSVQLTDDVIFKICIDYTRESGVRNLERTVSSICRGKAIEYSKLLQNTELGTLPLGYEPRVSQDQVAIYIGIPPHIKEELKLEQELSSKSGIVNGLSYNSDGSGSKLIFEMIALPSTSGFSMIMTGKLGEVLRESCKISQSLVKSILNNKKLNRQNDELLNFLQKNEFHLHVPMGSISKDGPSAGITMTMCLMSLVLNKPVPSNIAMTGEITLRGLILPIGGVMEKLLGAHLTRKIDKVLLPRLNRKDVLELYLKTNKNETEYILRQEETYLDNGTKKIFENAEKFILDKFGIHIIYVEELNDVFKLCWGDHDIEITSAIPEHLHL